MDRYRRSDWFDAIQRGLSYPLTRPWKAAVYAAVTFVFAAVCWFLVNGFADLVLSITRGIVAWGTSPGGIWNRGTEEEPISKLALLWGMDGTAAMHQWPDWSDLAWYEHFSGAL